MFYLKRKKVLAVDLDDTTIDLANPLFLYFNSVYKKYPQNTKLNDLSKNDKKIKLRDRFNLDKEKLYSHLRKFDKTDYWKNIKLIPGVRKGLNKLKDEYHLFLATIRPEEQKDFIVNMLEQKLKGVYDQHHFLGEKGKIEKLENLDVFCLIDDMVPNFEGIKNSKIKGILHSRFYNKDENCKELGLLGRYNWKQIPSILSQF